MKNVLKFKMFVVFGLLIGSFFYFTYVNAKQLSPTDLNLIKDDILDWDYINEKDINISYRGNLYTPDINEKIINSNTIKIGNKYKIFSGYTFDEVNGFYYNVEYATSTQTDFFENVDIMNISKTKFLDIFKINYVLAQDTVYSSTGDGRTYRGSYPDGVIESLSEIKAGNGTSYDSTNGLCQINIEGSGTTNKFEIMSRYIAFFDTSSITDTVTDVKFYFYVYANSAETGMGDVDLHAFQGYAGGSTVATSDYQLNDTQLSLGNITNTNITTSQYNYIDISDNDIINSTTTIIGLTNQWDIGSTTTGLGWGSHKNTYIGIRTADYTGVDSDPYLIITTEEEESTSTPIEYGTGCDPEYTNDISFINGCSYTSATTSATYWNFHAPALIYFFFFGLITLFFNKLLSILLARGKYGN